MIDRIIAYYLNKKFKTILLRQRKALLYVYSPRGDKTIKTPWMCAIKIDKKDKLGNGIGAGENVWEAIEETIIALNDDRFHFMRQNSDIPQEQQKPIN